jgi:hypothetical protein
VNPGRNTPFPIRYLPYDMGQKYGDNRAYLSIEGGIGNDFWEKMVIVRTCATKSQEENASVSE